jgi:hypothetical protein
VELIMEALKSLLHRMDEELPGERQRRKAWAAARTGIDRDFWQAAEAARLDLDLLRLIHRGATSRQPTVRRTLRDGRWTTAPSQPGRLRTKPQGFRAGTHIEPAWPAGQLKSGLSRLFGEVASAIPDDPVGQGARLLWTLSRAQPFAGANERVALALVSWCLQQAGLPGLNVLATEADPAFVAALVAGTAEECGTLVRYLTTAIWNEGLAQVEWLGSPAPGEAEGRTLKETHLALTEIRGRARTLSIERTDRFAERAAVLVGAELAARMGMVPACQRQWLGGLPERLQATWDSLARGRPISPHAPILMLQWELAVASGLQAELVIGAAGRGMSGALSAHLALGVRGLPTSGTAPAMLLVPDEQEQATDGRMAAWIGPAMTRAIAAGPLRF